MPMSRYDYEQQHEADKKIIEDLKSDVLALKNELAYYQSEAANVQKLKNEYQKILSDTYWNQKKNERGAGRKSMLTDNLIQTVHQYRTEGKTQREIAELLGISLGLTNKACRKRLN